MNINYIIKEVALIRASAGDYEAAHSKEDDLYCEFIHHIADGDFGKLSEMAIEVLKTQSISFPRHCA